MKKGYVAGSLFNEAEQKQRKYEGQQLREKTGDLIDWYNPVDADVNDKSKLPTALDIFHGDTEKVIHADYIIADITNNDLGVAKELGIAYGLQYARQAIDAILGQNDKEFLDQMHAALDAYGIKSKKLYAVCSDIRVADAHKYEGIEIPVGWNQYVIGGIESVPSVLVGNFDTALVLLLNDITVENMEEKTDGENINTEQQAE